LVSYVDSYLINTLWNNHFTTIEQDFLIFYIYPNPKSDNGIMHNMRLLFSKPPQSYC